ncbi:hypothetical protein GGR57DRAFT_513701 [Xylariaceae sp. FL1272]|nr:hypothetical protein GGR57DRAFT_513701 [Xylariaceae sp. FL1272]
MSSGLWGSTDPSVPENAFASALQQHIANPRDFRSKSELQKAYKPALDKIRGLMLGLSSLQNNHIHLELKVLDMVPCFMDYDGRSIITLNVDGRPIEAQEPPNAAPRHVLEHGWRLAGEGENHKGSNFKAVVVFITFDNDDFDFCRHRDLLHERLTSGLFRDSYKSEHCRFGALAYKLYYSKPTNTTGSHPQPSLWLPPSSVVDCTDRNAITFSTHRCFNFIPLENRSYRHFCQLYNYLTDWIGVRSLTAAKDFLQVHTGMMTSDIRFHVEPVYPSRDQLLGTSDANDLLGATCAIAKMQLRVALISSLTLLSSAGASFNDAQVDSQFLITSLTGKFTAQGSDAGSPIDASLKITLSYPINGTTSETTETVCNLGWPKTDGPGPTGWTLCDTPAVQWRIPPNGWSSTHNFHIDIFQILNYNGAGLYGTHGLIVNPGNTSNPDAYLSCLQMGKFEPDTCTINGPLSAQTGSVVVPAEPMAKKPS